MRSLKTYQLTMLESAQFLFFLMNNHRRLVNMITLNLSFRDFDLVTIKLFAKDGIPKNLHKKIIKEFDGVIEASASYSRGEW